MVTELPSRFFSVIESGADRVDLAGDDGAGHRSGVSAEQLRRRTRLGQLRQGDVSDLDVGERAGLPVDDDLRVAVNLNGHRAALLAGERDRIGADGLYDAAHRMPLRGGCAFRMALLCSCRAHDDDREGRDETDQEQADDFLH